MLKEMENVKPVVRSVKNTVESDFGEIEIAKVKLYGSMTEDMQDSKYAKLNNGKTALYSGKKFTQSRRNDIRGLATVEINGETWFFGVSKTGMSEGT